MTKLKFSSHQTSSRGSLVTRYYCSVCKETISEPVYRFSTDKFGKALCMRHQKTITPQGFFCVMCKAKISEQVYDYSLKHFGKALCMSHQKTQPKEDSTKSNITPQAQKLSAALTRNGVRHKMEAYDGYKHVDIQIPWARLNVEVDGRHHLTDSKQIWSDYKRDTYSHEDEFHTIRITNQAIDRDADGIAQAIAKFARRKRQEDENDEDIFSGLAKEIQSMFSKFF